VFFDMDGLLVDTEPLWFEVEAKVMARLGGRWSPADQRELIGGSMAHTVAYLLARATRPATPEQVAGWLNEGAARQLAARDLQPMPGAGELVAEVRAAGLPLALVTSSDRMIMEAVTRRLDGWFPVTVCADDVRHGKPDPEPYLLAAWRTGADPVCCVALEDSPRGLASAEAAGCATIAVPGIAPVTAAPGRLVVRSLADVDLATLRALAADRDHVIS
jgi:HAD superfamily hydrolase (TIGR01509 family)